MDASLYVYCQVRLQSSNFQASYLVLMLNKTKLAVAVLSIVNIFINHV